MTKTYATKKSDIAPKWHHFDAAGKVLGGLSTQIVKLLTGKHKVNYVPYLNMGDKVIVTNAKKVVLTRDKDEKKVYYRHMGYIGGIKKETVAHLRERKPNELIFKAVRGMLPKNRLRSRRLANLYVYEGSSHPHNAQLKGKSNGLSKKDKNGA